MLTSIFGKPGPIAEYPAQPREIFWQDRDKALWIGGPVTIDGTASCNPQNIPTGQSSNSIYGAYLFAGTLMGKATTGGKYSNSVIDTTTAAYTSGGTTLTVSKAGAAEIVRRIGNSGTLAVTGPATANTTITSSQALVAVTFSAVSTTTGNITISSPGVSFVKGSLVGANDGSADPVTLLGDYPDNPRVCDQLGNRLDVYSARLWAGGGVVNETMLWPSWPTDTGIQSWIVAEIRKNVPDAKFRYALQNS
jgi:hypothetical protein